MSELPKVYVTSAAKETGRLQQARDEYAAAVARGEHVHWYSPKKRVCRNGTGTCPLHVKKVTT